MEIIKEKINYERIKRDMNLTEAMNHIESQGNNSRDAFVCIFKEYIKGHFTILEHTTTKERKAVFICDSNIAIYLDDMFEVIKNIEVDYENLPD